MPEYFHIILRKIKSTVYLILLILFFSNIAFGQNNFNDDEIEGTINENNEAHSESISNNYKRDKVNGALFIGYKKVNLSITGYKNAVFNDDHFNFFGSNPGKAFIEFENENRVITDALDIIYSIQNPNYEFNIDFFFIADKVNSWGFIIGSNYIFSVGSYIEIFAGAGIGILYFKQQIGKLENIGNIPIDIETGEYNSGDSIEVDLGNYLTELRGGVYINFAYSYIYLMYSSINSIIYSKSIFIAGDEITDKEAFDKGSKSGNFDSDSNINPISDVNLDFGDYILSMGLGIHF